MKRKRNNIRFRRNHPILEQARGERYREALRQALQKYPNVARAWSFGVWTEATVAEIWPHIVKQSPHRYL